MIHIASYSLCTKFDGPSSHSFFLQSALLIVTFLFNSYLRQEHFHVASFLPSSEGTEAEKELGDDDDLSFLKDAFLQEELRNEYVYPDIPEETAAELDLLPKTDSEIAKEEEHLYFE